MNNCKLLSPPTPPCPSILKFLSFSLRTQINYLETISFLQTLLLRRATFKLELIMLPHLRQYCSETSIQCPVDHEVFHSGFWENVVFLALCDF